jgi:hypothetical protein
MLKISSVSSVYLHEAAGELLPSISPLISNTIVGGILKI